MHQTFGDTVKDLNPITHYLTYTNLVKDDLITYLQLTTPLFTNLENKKKQEIFTLINEIFFGVEDKDAKMDELKGTLKHLQKAISNIHFYLNFSY